MRPITLLALGLMFSPSCATRRAATSFQIVPARPDYLLRSPDSKKTAFPDVLGRYAHVGPGWVELRSEIELRVENAYFREGTPKRGLANFLGTEIARYQMLATGALEQISVQSQVEKPPSDQPPVQQLLNECQKRYPHHRLFYQVLVSKKADIRSAVLLSAASIHELDRFTEQLLSEPDSICGSSTHCTVFPEACSVSLEIEIVVNGVPRKVPWSSVLADVGERHRHVELFRPYTGRLAPVEIDPTDPGAFRLPLLPGDRVKWR